MIGGLFTGALYNVGNNLAAFGGAFVEKGNYTHSFGSITSAIAEDYGNDAKDLWARAGRQQKDGKWFSSALNRVGAAYQGGMGLLTAGTVGVASDAITSVTKPLSYATGALTKGAGNLTLGIAEGVSMGLLNLAGKAAVPLAQGATMATMAGAQVAGKMAVEAAGIGAGVGAFLWKTRRNPVVGLPVFLGSLVAGGAMGAKDAGINSTMNLENTNVIQPNYYFDNAGMTPGSNNPVRTVDTMGATGDLVFALNNSRKGGFL